MNKYGIPFQHKFLLLLLLRIISIKNDYLECILAVSNFQTDYAQKYMLRIIFPFEKICHTK